MGYGSSSLVSVVLLFSALAECSLDFQCLKCLCETATGCASVPCDPVKCAKVEINNYECTCGPFGISPSFWITANKPTLSEKDGTEAEKFKKCVETYPCSIWTVQYYMDKYAEDCDNDNVINCDDYVLIYHYGPKGCHNSSLNEDRMGRYKTCMSRKEIIRGKNKNNQITTTTSTVKTTESLFKDEDSALTTKKESSSTGKPIAAKMESMRAMDWMNDSF
ncbi:lysozyme-like [Harmonia axyridis]|uniref:lysozyme-like n=1 Tax=Harmonia axyridis TaxID=115357 RepID=UPI001E2780B5|nr:lysozyme-like [Harmonia axyridis]